MMFKKLFIIFASVVAIWTVNFFVFRGALENIFFNFSKPLLSVVTEKTLGLSSYGRNLLQASKLGAEITVLKIENHKLLVLWAESDKLQEENDALRTRLNLTDNSKQQSIFANVYSMRGTESATSFLIDKGSADGVEPGQAVVTAENILAGVVYKTYTNNATVLMPQNKDLYLNVRVSGMKTLSRSQSNGQKVVLEFVTSQDEVKVDDLVVTSGFDKIPKAIPVFKVTTIQAVKGNLFQEVTVRPIFNILETPRVFVLK